MNTPKKQPSLDDALSGAMSGLVSLPTDIRERMKQREEESRAPAQVAAAAPAPEPDREPDNNVALDPNAKVINRTGTRLAPYTRKRGDKKQTIKMTFSVGAETEQLLRERVVPFLPPGLPRNDLIDEILLAGLQAWVAKREGRSD